MNTMDMRLNLFNQILCQIMLLIISINPLNAKMETFSGKWNKSIITWGLDHNISHIGIERNNVLMILREAFNMWNVYIPVEVREAPFEIADIRIFFDKEGHEHGQYGFAFKPGPGIGGDIHLNEQIGWRNFHGGKMIKLLYVAVHESGHALGLRHNPSKKSVMYRSLKIRPLKQLPSIDIRSITKLYGEANPSIPDDQDDDDIRCQFTTTFRSSSTQAVRRGDDIICYDAQIDESCNKCVLTTYDTITVINGKLVLFKAKNVWFLPLNGSVNSEIIMPTKKTCEYWRGLSCDFVRIDAVYQAKCKIVFFIGETFYEFDTLTDALIGTGKLTDIGLPSNIEQIQSAFHWIQNDMIYIFGEVFFWTFNEVTGKINPDSKKRILHWLNVRVKSVFSDSRDYVYIFDGYKIWKWDHTFRTYSTEIQVRQNVMCSL